MITKVTKVLCLLFFAIITRVVSKQVNYESCSDDEICEVTQVRIDPCVQGPKPCKVKKGTDISISFDYLPQFNASSVEMAAYWANGIEPAIGDLDDEACKYTHCALVKGKKRELNYRLRLSKKWPTGLFPIKWKIWNEVDRAQSCCFIVQISLKR